MADFDSSDYLSFTGNTAYDPGADTSTDYGDTSSIFDRLGNLFGNQGVLRGIGTILGGANAGSPLGNAGQFAAFGGLAALLNRMMGDQQQRPVGYQGGIPKFVYERAQTPMSQQRPDGYRPGQGGIAYFTPGRYVPAGYTPKSAEEFLTRPAVSPPPQTPPNPPAQPPSDSLIPEFEVPSAASGGQMRSGIAMLAKGGHGSRYLRGPGDGVSDDIKAKFEGSGQPARLADGEFVIDARTVSEIGNGSSEAGARKLYAMMDRVHAKRKSAKRGKPSGADRELNRLA